jgi:hypothetical protein
MNIHNDYTNPIDDKISLLRDFCLLKRNASKQEAAVRQILGDCETETQMEQKLYNVLHGKETLKDFIARHNTTQGGT